MFVKWFTPVPLYLPWRIWEDRPVRTFGGAMPSPERVTHVKSLSTNCPRLNCVLGVKPAYRRASMARSAPVRPVWRAGSDWAACRCRRHRLPAAARERRRHCRPCIRHGDRCRSVTWWQVTCAGHAADRLHARTYWMTLLRLYYNAAEKRASMREFDNAWHAHWTGSEHYAPWRGKTPPPAISAPRRARNTKPGMWLGWHNQCFWYKFGALGSRLSMSNNVIYAKLSPFRSNMQGFTLVGLAHKLRQIAAIRKKKQRKHNQMGYLDYRLRFDPRSTAWL